MPPATRRPEARLSKKGEGVRPRSGRESESDLPERLKSWWLHPQVVPRVQFLGTGNAHSPPGRMHALACIDEKILVDAPPTLMPQLRRAGINPGDIEHLLFTHWHADHMFGFPFLMLERKYVVKPESPLSIHCRPGGTEILTGLCETGFPGSLGEFIEGDVGWNGSESGSLEGTGWSFERFPVSHVPATDPHGYLLTYESGFTLLHCGDSGPCEAIESRAASADAILVEMGIPDFVNSPYHHTPNQVIALAERHPNALVLVTHNFADGEAGTGGFPKPELGDNIVQLEDGDEIHIDESGGFSLVKK